VSIEAVIFDLDGVLIDSEPVWSEVRHAYVQAHGGHWTPDADENMMGMSSQEWSQYLHDHLGVPLPPPRIYAGVVELVMAQYHDALPLLPGADEAPVRLAEHWPLGLASSSPPQVIALVLATAGVAERFSVTASTEEVGAGKPAPDIYLLVAERLGVAPDACAAVEDSTVGLRAARAAGMRVIAVPTASRPPDPDELARADVVLDSLQALTPEVVTGAR
jgi:beta-phosphoglucomutase-like phosphatase (HAD superfamily)